MYESSEEDSANVDKPCDSMLYLSYYSSHYNVAIENSNVYRLEEIRDFEDSEEIHEINRLISLGMISLWLKFVYFLSSELYKKKQLSSY